MIFLVHYCVEESFLLPAHKFIDGHAGSGISVVLESGTIVKEAVSLLFMIGNKNLHSCHLCHVLRIKYAQQNRLVPRYKEIEHIKGSTSISGLCRAYLDGDQGKRANHEELLLGRISIFIIP